MFNGGFKNWETYNVAKWITEAPAFHQIARFCEDYDEFADAVARLGIPDTGDSVRWNDPKLDIIALNEIIKTC